MNIFSSSIHTHANLCHGADSLTAMAEAACTMGIQYLGISCHAHTPIPLDEGCVLPRDMSAYRQAVWNLRRAYEGRLEVLLGLEWDSRSDVSPTGFDYWIGSVHYQKGQNGRWYCPNWSKAHFAACRDECFHGDALAVAEDYYADMAQVAAMRPTVLGHFDLIAKHNAAAQLFDEASPRYRAAALDALRAADPERTLLEINSGGMARGYRTAPYPALFILREWRAMGGRIILTSDAHRAADLLSGYEVSRELALAAGYREASLLTLAGERTCKL